MRKSLDDAPPRCWDCLSMQHHLKIRLPYYEPLDGAALTKNLNFKGIG